MPRPGKGGPKEGVGGPTWLVGGEAWAPLVWSIAQFEEEYRSCYRGYGGIYRCAGLCGVF